MPTYTPLTPEQFSKARAAGFSTDQIISMEQKRKVQLSGTPSTAATEPDTHGATFPASPNDNPLEAGAKAAGNLPSSAFDLAKTLVQAGIHPLDTIHGIGSAIVGGASELGRKLGTGANVGKPATQEEQTFEAVVNAFKERYGTLENAQRTATNDPVGFGSDVVGLLAGGAGALGKTAELGGAASKVASVVTKPVAKVAAKSAEIGTGAAKFSASQAMGLSDDTLAQIVTHPDNFTKDAQASVNRRTIAEDVQAALAARQENLSETGAHYGSVRDTNATLNVEPDFLANALSKHAGVEVTDGQLKPLTTSKIRSGSDVRALQNLYDFWQPAFEKGTITAQEFLNLRSDLADLSKFDRQIGKSLPLETTAQGIRKDLNTNYRGTIPDLANLDTDFAAQQSDFSRLAKGVINRDGDLTDTAINRIANATGKGKDLLIDRLEEAAPGITQRIKTLKAVEDIQSLKGQIPGKYGRAGLFLGAAYTINPWLIAGTVLALPELGVPILRGVGMTAPKIQNTLRLLGVGAKAINETPAAAAAALPIAQEPK